MREHLLFLLFIGLSLSQSRTLISFRLPATYYHDQPRTVAHYQTLLASFVSCLSFLTRYPPPPTPPPPPPLLLPPSTPPPPLHSFHRSLRRSTQRGIALGGLYRLAALHRLGYKYHPSTKSFDSLVRAPPSVTMWEAYAELGRWWRDAGLPTLEAECLSRATRMRARERSAETDPRILEYGTKASGEASSGESSGENGGESSGESGETSGARQTSSSVYVDPVGDNQHRQ